MVERNGIFCTHGSPLVSDEPHWGSALVRENSSGEPCLPHREDCGSGLVESLRRQTPMGYQSLDAAGRLQDVNEAWLKLLGYETREDVLGRPFEDFLSESSRRVFQERFGCFKSIGHFNDQDFEMVRKDGATIFALSHGHVARGETGQLLQMHCLLQDVTERLRADERLGESEELFRTAFEFAPIGMALLGIDGHFLQVNLELCRILGYTMEEILAKTYDDVCRPVNTEKSTEAFGEMLSGKICTTQLENLCVHKEGHELWVIVNASVVRSGTGIPLHFIMQFRDITDSRRTEQERTLLTAACEQIAEGLAILNLGGVIHFVNPAFEQLTGVSPGTAVGCSWSQLNIGRINARHSREMWTCLAQGEAWTGRMVLERAGEESLELETNASPIRDASGAITHCALILRDVTQERKMELHLRQAHKMEAIGTLAGGIAHDFNNILAAILGYTELAQMKAQGNRALQQNLDQVFKAANRARDLVKQILTFSRKREEPLKPLEIGIVVKEVLKLLRASLPATIEIRPRIHSKSCVAADPTQIHQVIMNLCTNAAHAMKERGGVLTLTLEDVAFQSPELAGYGGVEAGDYVLLTVSDTGHGMSEDVLRRVFDPFFTTKGPGEGTGMGLAVVHGIVQSHRGALSVESELGKGTTFRILFPRCEALFQENPRRDQSEVIEGGSESILVVDDEQALLESVKQMLTLLGYNVTVSATGEEAYRLFKKNPSGFDLLLTDQTMPGLTGVELAQLFFSVREDLPVILCSGYSNAMELERHPGHAIKVFLSKPVLMEDLSSAVRRALNKESAADRMDQDSDLSRPW